MTDKFSRVISIASLAGAVLAIALSAHLIKKVSSFERQAFTPMSAAFWHASVDKERYTDLPITKPPTCYEFRSVFSVELPELKAGDLIIAHATFEVTNPYDYVIMAGRFIVLGDSPDDTMNLRIGPAATRNILPAMHHDHKEQHASYVVREDMPAGKFVNLVTYTASMLVQDPSQIAVIEQGYGSLMVNVIRGAGVSPEYVSTPKPAPVDPNCVPLSS